MGLGAPTPRKLAPQAGRGGCPRSGAPTFPGYVRWGGRGTQPLSGLVCPLTCPIRPPNTCRGLPKPLSVMLVITRYPWNTSGLQYPSSNISIFTSGPFQSSSSCRRSHLGLRTTFANHHNDSTILISPPNVKCVDHAGSRTMQT